MIVVLANENVIKQGTGGGEGVVLVWLLFVEASMTVLLKARLLMKTFSCASKCGISII